MEQQRPELLVVGGANGAGKSTFAHAFLCAHPGFVFLNADEIAHDLRPDDMYAARFEAAKEFLRRLVAFREQKISVVLESTLAGLSLAAQLRQFQAAGYHVRIVYVFLNAPGLSVSRVAGRVLSGGHYVPTEDIIRRFSRSQRNFWHTYRNLVSEWQLLYNADAEFVEVAECKADALSVLDDVLFRQFVLDQDSDFRFL